MWKSGRISFVQKILNLNSSTCSCEIGEQFASTIDSSVITCNETISTADSVSGNVLSIL